MDGQGNKGNTMETSKILVTPELAKSWLARNTRNRKVIESSVVDYTAAIKEGWFKTTHQGIAIAPDGTLLDGQHRLLAVVRADMPVTMQVSFNVPTDSMEAIDTGNIRRAHDVLQIADGTESTTALRAACTTARRLLRETLVGKRGRISVHELRLSLADHGADAAAVLALLGKRHDRIGQAPLVAALTIVHKVFPSEVNAFAELVHKGSDLPDRHPALALRNFVLVNYRITKDNAREDLACRTFSAFEAYQAGTERLFVKKNTAAKERYAKLWFDAASQPTDPTP